MCYNIQISIGGVRLYEGTTKAVIDLDKNAVYAVRDGELIKVPTPPDGFGSQLIHWEHGKPLKGKWEGSFKLK